MYLTGINQLGVTLLLNPLSKSEPEVLFCLPKNKDKEFWDGVRFGASDLQDAEFLKQNCGIMSVESSNKLKKYLSRIFSDNNAKNLGIFWHQSKSKVIKDVHYNFKNKLKAILKRLNCKVEIQNIQDIVWEQRLVADSADIEMMTKAITLSGDAFMDTAAKLQKCKTETELAGSLTGELLSRTPYGLSFPMIVAGGQNAAVLHYTKNNDELPRNGLVLLDFGARWQSMLADVSRAIPISGKFNPLQHLVYTIVLNAQEKVEAFVKPGVTINQLNNICWQFINKELHDQIKLNGGVVKTPYKLQPHNVSHLIGRAVHDGDPYRNYRSQPLQGGWMISNEPGFYGQVEMTINGKLYQERLGIRIEDTLLVIRNGCQNLTKSIPKSIEDIEAFLKMIDRPIKNDR